MSEDWFLDMKHRYRLPPIPTMPEVPTSTEFEMRRRIAKALRSIACGTPDAIAQARAELVSALEL